MVRALLASVPLAAALCLMACTGEAELGEQRGVLLGAASSDGTGVATNLLQLEQLIGRPLMLDRVYRQWDNADPAQRELASIAAGRVPIVSFNGRRPPDTAISWRSVAAGEQDVRLAEIAASFRALGSRVFAIYHQEPDDDEAEFGTAEEYRRALRHVVELFRQNDALNVVWIWNLRSTAFATRADEFYPGDDVVDWIGAGAFNYGTEGEGSRWISLRGLLSDFTAWAPARSKPLILSEFACTEDAQDATRKAQWLDDARTTLRELPDIRAAAYFHNPESAVAANSSPEALAAFRRLAQDPYTN